MAPPKKDTMALTVRLDQQMLAQIDALRRDEPDIPTRPEMIRRMLDSYLASRA